MTFSEQVLRPDLIISVGTAGGFAARGAAIGDVFVATGFANHDRRIPLPVKLKSKACEGSACCFSTECLTMQCLVCVAARDIIYDLRMLEYYSRLCLITHITIVWLCLLCVHSFWGSAGL